MNLVPKTRIGPYDILSPLGVGGMGEVYRARDTRLGREVAIKLLPTEYSNHTDRLRRFEEEAKTLASLNHPNIPSIFDTGVHDGAPYLVSELLEGQTLREVLRGGAIAQRKVAQGVAAAHAKGIIHRDLKPENIFISK